MLKYIFWYLFLFGIIDRIEEGVAVVELENGSYVHIDSSNLNLKEGDRILFLNEKETNYIRTENRENKWKRKVTR